MPRRPQSAECERLKAGAGGEVGLALLARAEGQRLGRDAGIGGEDPAQLAVRRDEAVPKMGIDETVGPGDLGRGHDLFHPVTPVLGQVERQQPQMRLSLVQGRGRLCGGNWAK